MVFDDLLLFGCLFSNPFIDAGVLGKNSILDKHLEELFDSFVGLLYSLCTFIDG